VPQTHTKSGRLTRYGLACGYIEHRGSHDAYVKLEQLSSNGTLRVHVGGRYVHEDVYTGPNLVAAREWFDSVDPVARNANAAAQ
jgi:hypothetical protein